MRKQAKMQGAERAACALRHRHTASVVPRIATGLVAVVAGSVGLAGCAAPQSEPMEPRSRQDMLMTTQDKQFVNAERVGPNWAEGTPPSIALSETLRVLVAPRARENKILLVPAAGRESEGSRVLCSVPPITTAEELVYAWVCRPEAAPGFD
ncbi:MAG: hypothetical protein ACOC1F_01775 [Myxococcota bacterium]